MSPLGRSRIVAGWVALISAVGLGVAATDRAPFELGVLGGIQLSHEVVTFENRTIDAGPSAGLRAEWSFAPRWSLYIDALLSNVSAAPAFGDARTLTGRVGAEWTVTPNARWPLFFTGGAGLLDVDYDQDAASAVGFSRELISGGIGQRFAAGPRTTARWELRGDHSLGDDGIFGARYGQGQLLVGISWGFGHPVNTTLPPRPTSSVESGLFPAMRLPGDDDGDGVADARDRCPGTPVGVRVDRAGCAPDDDEDGVPDDLDICQRTARGIVVGVDGCPRDLDADGVIDLRDTCPATPKGAFIDERGCPIDTDRDGVPEGLDVCPRTPRGATIDSRGCERDTDGDGVLDGIDGCPNTPLHDAVDGKGCPLKG